MSKQKSPVCGYDFTLGEEFVNRNELTNILKKYTKKWTFQLEKGESENGYIHYQGRFLLKVKARVTAVKKFFVKQIHLSITSSENRDNMFYVIKNESRIAGPWSNNDPYVPRQLREIDQLFKWQQFIVDDASVWNTRTINVIIDKIGNNGKTILKTHIGVRGIGRSIPFSNDYRDIMRMVMATKKVPLYIIDIPKGIRKENLFQFFSGLETIKDGYAYDDRYSFREEYFDCPNIWVFMNHKPDKGYLSLDRWKLWSLKDKVLSELSEDEDDETDDEDTDI